MAAACLGFHTHILGMSLGVSCRCHAHVCRCTKRIVSMNVTGSLHIVYHSVLHMQTLGMLPGISCRCHVQR